MRRLDCAMSGADGVTDFARQYTLASGGPCCGRGYHKKAGCNYDKDHSENRRHDVRHV